MDNNIKIKNPNPKKSAIFLSKLTFMWLINFCRKASTQNLKLHDLYENLLADKSDKLGNSLEENWKREREMAKEKNINPSLFRAIQKTFFYRYMFHGLLQCLQACIIRPMQPMVLGIFISLFSKIEDRNNDDVVKKMYLYGGLVLLIAIQTLFFYHHEQVFLGQIGMRVRIACCSIIYRKVLRLSRKSQNESTAGKIVNLLSNDVGRFDLLAPYLHFIWIMPLQATVVTYLIWKKIGVSAFIAMGSLIILTIPVHAYFGKLMSVFRLNIAKRTDIRLKKMAEIITGIQVIKMYAWEKPFAKIVGISRKKEIDYLSWTSYLRGITLSSSLFVERTILFITVITYVFLGNTITADILFSMAQFFYILQTSTTLLFSRAINVGAETLISIERLQEFLMLEEKIELLMDKNQSKGVRLKHIQASWIPTTIVLKNISLEIPSGCLCVIVGPVGSGKSSLLQLILGELIPEHGAVELGGDVSYAAQEPWLFASTVQNNILFGKKYDPEIYTRVVKVCALEEDFELLPHGDKTRVGERGMSLSGGQKARINLARAVYRDADIYLLDDPLSAVDTYVGKQLFDECIIGYLKNKTKILVTHQLQYLKEADHIVVIHNGEIEAQGTFSELSKSKVDFTKMLAVADESGDVKGKELTIAPCIVKNGSVLSSLSVLSEKNKSMKNSQSSEDEEKVTALGASIYLEYAKTGGNMFVLFGLLVIFIAGQVASNSTDLWLTYWTRQKPIRTTCKNVSTTIVDPFVVVIPLAEKADNQDIYVYETHKMSMKNNVGVDDDECVAFLTTNVAIYIHSGLIVICIILLILRSLYFFKVAMTSSKNLHNNMFSSLLHAPMRFFDTNPSGRILNRFSRDMGMIDEILPGIMLEALQIFLFMTGILVVVFITNIYMMPIALALSILFYVIQGWYVATARQIKHLEGITQSPVFSHITASLDGLLTIRASLAEKILVQEFDWHQDTHTSAWYLILVCFSAFGLWLDFLSFVFSCCVTFGCIIMNQYNPVDGSMVGLAISQALMLNLMVQYGMRQAAEVVSQMTSVERVLEYTKLHKEEPQETSNDKSLELWPSAGAINFHWINLRYSTSEPPVLKNLNFTVKAGDKIGIVGRTGAGKSSLISALFRLALVEGSITIDDVDTRGIGLNDLRKRISIIPQEPVLFSATLRYNLDPFGEFSDESIWKAIEEVELKDAASSLDFVVQEGGSNFSIGQRQLVCLARAVLKNNKILVLDEATANVDPRTDAFIQQTIRNKFSTCTVLTVAHRLHTIIDSDKVLVMDAGTLVEYDHPYKLLQNPGGYFSKMVAQTGSTIAAELHKVAENTYFQIRRDEGEEKSSYL